VSRQKSFCVPQFKYQLLASLQKPVLLSTRSQPASPHDFPVFPPLPPFAWMHAAMERRRGPKCFRSERPRACVNTVTFARARAGLSRADATGLSRADATQSQDAQHGRVQDGALQGDDRRPAATK
jgi:hypothetical protein